MQWAQTDVRLNLSERNITPIVYRPFDTRWTFYTGKSRGFVCYPRYDTMRHLLKDNLALCTNSQTKDGYGGFVVKSIGGHKVYGAYDINAYFPLYLYPSEGDLDQTRRVNFDPALYEKLQTLTEHPDHGTPNELAVFDYLYGVLHCPVYRETYAEFLKIDFPRIPWPTSPDEFWDVSQKGGLLRRLHLMDPAAIGPTPYPFIGDGTNLVDKPRFEDGKIWINPTQYFDAAPAVSWTFYIGGYQPIPFHTTLSIWVVVPRSAG